MKNVTRVLLVLGMVGTLSLSAFGDEAQPSAAPLTTVSAQQIAQAREAGPKGLAEIMAAYRRDGAPGLEDAVDQVAAQKDAIYSRLYWYTDMTKAKAAAAQEGKKIIYLRLLGKLTDEYSCANSRYFRSVLYADPVVSARMRENFILVWESERPVPVVTIDYGDGRVIKRTLTGNSIHYILDSNGTVIDAMPGLYSPEAFMKVLDQVKTFEPGKAKKYHQAVINGLAEEYKPIEQKRRAARVAEMEASRPVRTASRAMALSVTKTSGEAALFRGLSYENNRALADALRDVEWSEWEAEGAKRPVTLSPESTQLITRKLKEQDNSPGRLTEIIAQFQRNIAADTARNQAVLRPHVHRLLEIESYANDVTKLNEVVYSSVFNTPRTDPWLGLVDPNAYVALSAVPDAKK